MKSNSGGGGGGKWRITIQVFSSPERIDRRVWKESFFPRQRNESAPRSSGPTNPRKKGKRSSSDLVLLQKECKFGETALLGGRKGKGRKGGPHTRCRKISSRSPPLLSAVVPHISHRLPFSQQFSECGKKFSATVFVAGLPALCSLIVLNSLHMRWMPLQNVEVKEKPRGLS